MKGHQSYSFTVVHHRLALMPYKITSDIPETSNDERQHQKTLSFLTSLSSLALSYRWCHECVFRP
jgi:hypothetical protein